MTKGSLEKYRAILEGLRNGLLEGASSGSETLDSLNLESGVDWADRAEFESARRNVFSAGYSRENSLREIEEALQRLDRGEFGICVRCDEPIEDVRLEALPLAALCLKCKRAEESE